jgi:thiol reductant ABC exporter CydD subunit
VKPLDPRLVASVRPVRVHLAASSVAAVLATGLVLLQAWSIASAITGTTDAGTAVAAVAGVAVARAVLTAVAETAALRSAARVVSTLRMRLVRHVTATPSADAGEVATLATRGLDGLTDYVAKYLPQLVLAAVVPAAVLVVLAATDWVSALVVAISLPLIPLFMALVGRHTEASTQRQWHLLERLGGQFLDAVEGLPTLAVFRRAKATAALVRTVSERHRDATMGTLRIAFLSAFVLELLATLAVALVAVEIGLRVLYGELGLTTALFVLILAPEAYLPVREVGARFHASIEGVTAAARVFAVLSSPGAPPSGTGCADARGEIVFSRVGLTYERPALQDLDLRLEPGTTTLVTGPSGAGKTSLLNLLLRFRAPTAGRITVGGVDLADVDAAMWRRQLAWVPQQPYLFDTSVADNIRLGAPSASDAAVERAARLAGVHDEIVALPDGYATRLGERGSRLSAGQRQRVAIARAFLVDAPLVLLDEPTAHLDAANAAQVRAAVARLATGRTTVIVAHDEGWTELADTMLALPPRDERHVQCTRGDERAARPGVVMGAAL